MAQNEGVFLDPVYSSKAMSGLVDHVRTKKLSARHTVVFVHIPFCVDAAFGRSIKAATTLYVRIEGALMTCSLPDRW
jgi:hypothetical protein